MKLAGDYAGRGVLEALLAKRYGLYEFHPGHRPIQNWFTRLIGWPTRMACCGTEMMRFHATFRSSGRPETQVGFYGCQWCGRVE